MDCQRLGHRLLQWGVHPAPSNQETLSSTQRFITKAACLFRWLTALGHRPNNQRRRRLLDHLCQANSQDANGKRSNQLLSTHTDISDAESSDEEDTHDVAAPVNQRLDFNAFGLTPRTPLQTYAQKLATDIGLTGKLLHQALNFSTVSSQ